MSFIGHLTELRARLAWCLACVLLSSILGYILAPTLIRILLLPLHAPVYYSSPAGGFSLLIAIAMMFAVIASLPVLLFHGMRFVLPAFRLPVRAITLLVGSSWFLAGSGIAFAYFLSLPAALRFLQGFASPQVRSLITADQYFSFVTRYLLLFGVLFQLPLIFLLVDRIARVQPRKLLRYQRHLVVAAFVIGALFSPAIDPVNQTLVALPIIALYYVSLGLLAIVHARRT
ncbi:MAG: twin-arginine translocase subunit TatC [Thermomicrobiales bacterium]